MTKHFLKIYDYPFYKLKLLFVKNMGFVENSGKNYYNLHGKFKFKPPAFILDEDLIANRIEILNGLLKAVEISKLFRKKYTKKIIGESTTNFNFMFDLKPTNIIDFDVEDEFIILTVKGFGI